MKKYQVTLTPEQRQALHHLISAGSAPATRQTHARILLKADAAMGGPGWSDGRIAEAIEVSVATVERIRKRFVGHGLEAALVRKRQDRPSRRPKLDDQGRARLLALAGSVPPEGCTGWTLQRLADQLVALHVVDAISAETVRQMLKRATAGGGLRYWPDSHPSLHRAHLPQQRCAEGPTPG